MPITSTSMWYMLSVLAARASVAWENGKSVSALSCLPFSSKMAYTTFLGLMVSGSTRPGEGSDGGDERRRLVVALTTAGRDLLDRYRDQVHALEATMVAGLSPADIHGLRHSLDTCHANLAAAPA
jgi:hypothetical protein